MSWIVFALLAPLLYGVSTTIDGYLTNKPFKNLWTLVCFGATTPVLFVPVLWLLAPPVTLPPALWPHVISIGLIEIAYFYPYYRALQHDDVSVVTSLFALGKIFVPLLAYFVVQETLSLSQYAGFAVIICASALLTLNGRRWLRFSGALPNMAFVSLLLSIQVVLYKTVFTEVSWSTGVIWPTFVTALGGVALFLASPSVRAGVRHIFKTQRTALALFGLEEVFTFSASLSATFAISLVPVTVQQGVGAAQPFFVMLLGLGLRRFFPEAAHESTDRTRMLKKVILFALMAAGVLLIGGAD